MLDLWIVSHEGNWQVVQRGRRTNWVDLHAQRYKQDELADKLTLATDASSLRAHRKVHPWNDTGRIYMQVRVAMNPCFMSWRCLIDRPLIIGLQRTEWSAKSTIPSFSAGSVAANPCGLTPFILCMSTWTIDRWPGQLPGVLEKIQPMADGTVQLHRTIPGSHHCHPCTNWCQHWA